MIFIIHALVLGFSVVAAKADLNEMLLNLGPEMIRYSATSKQDNARTVLINGQSIKLSVGTTNDSVNQVLDQFEDRCAKHDGRLNERLDKTPYSKLFDSTLRHDSEKRGYVACFDFGEGELDVKELSKRLNRFAESGNISEVGEFRYFYVERGKEKTLFANLWSEGSLNIFEMFPNQGDAPGFDLPDVPRPGGSRRLISAKEVGHPQTLAIYGGAKQNGRELFRFYQKVLAKSGWDLSEDPDALKRQKTSPHTLVAEKGSRMVAIVTGTNSDGRGFANVMSMH
ncbi:MAG: hypothetical protein IPJ88_04345 [Myxococcales bacterium]|nr:MAG: hypothetical protein IPJ88_04345 [Myxococcales bacterium]